MGCGVWGLGFGVQGSVFGVWVLGFGVCGHRMIFAGNIFKIVQ